MVNKIGSLLDGLFPARCALCGLRSGRTLPLCVHCEGNLTPNHHPCTRCGLPLSATIEAQTVHNRRCGSCQRQQPTFSGVTAPWIYDSNLARLLSRWKYQRDRQLSLLMVHLLLHSMPAKRTDILLPMPLNWRRQLWRGFNQSAVLADGVMRQYPRLASGKATEALRLRRTSSEGAQAKLGARQRAALSSRCFTVTGACENLDVTVIDDVLTTGATANALAGALLSAGARTVKVWCIARTPAPGGNP